MSPAFPLFGVYDQKSGEEGLIFSDSDQVCCFMANEMTDASLLVLSI